MADPRAMPALKDLLEKQGLGGGAVDKSVRVKRSTLLAIANNTPTVVTWDTEDYDTDAMFAATSTDITVKTAGKWYLNATIKWENVGFTNIRRIEFLVDGTVKSKSQELPGSAQESVQTFSDVLSLAIGEVVTVRVFHTSSVETDILVEGDYAPAFKMQLLAAA